jgi:hypothetical protein
MTKFKQFLVFAFAVGALSLSSGNALAQGQAGGGAGGGGGRGNFDPAQFQQRMMDRYREEFDIKSDDEWKAIQPRVEKVMQVRRELMAFGGNPFGGGRGPRPGGNADANANGGNQNRRGGFRGEPSPEADSLQKAIEAKASGDEIKSKLAKYRDARKAKESELDKAQDDLRKVLTVKQEAVAVMAGLLK